MCHTAQERKRNGCRSSASGFTLIELMISMIVLTAGLLALTGLLVTAIYSNHRNKVDSTATMVAQSVIEHMNAAMSSSNVTHLTDCMNHTQEISVTADGGARLLADGSGIDFSEATPPSDYSMMFTICSTDPATGQQMPTAYDVRWHVQTITGNGTYMITAGAVAAGTPAPNRDLKMFAFPSNLRVMIGPEPSPSGPGSGS
jgi:prepilin-type N-terminal cleavage/methylation domain-containing protein